MRRLLKANRLIGLLAAALPFLAGCATPDQPRPESSSSDRIPAAVTNAIPPAPTGPLTVEQAVRQALACNRQIASLRAAVQVAFQRRRAATDITDPELRVQTRSSTQSGSSTWIAGDDSEIMGIFFLPNPWLVVPRVDARKADLRAAEADLRAASWLVTCDVRRFFAEINYLTNDMAFAVELVRLNGDILKAVRSRAEQGAATASDVVTATRRYLQIQDDLDQTRHRYQLAQRGLAALLDMPPDSLRVATNTLAFPSLPESGIPFDQADRTAKQCRGDVAALHWRVLAAGFAYREARNVRLPWIKELRAGYRDYSEQWWGGLQMDVPIFSWMKNHADDVARAQETLAGVNETEGMRLVSQEIRDAIDQLDESRRQQARYDNDVAPLIAAMRQTLATLRNTPNVMPDQVAATELQLVETLRLDLGSHWRYHLALLNLERALGAPLCETIKKG